jgi:transposase
MSLKLLAIDLGKRSFHCYGIDSDGLIISRKTSRSKLLETIRKLAPETVAMEACASAHYWGRLFLADGRQVLLINPRFVKPFVKGSKNDAADAEGIYEAALRPTMRFVPVKSTEQQDLQSLHRARERVVCARTALINHMRGLLGEYGVIFPKAHGAFWRRRRTPSRPPSSQISRENSSATCSTNSAASISDSTSSTGNSWPFAGRTKPAGGSLSCQASGP